MLQSVCQSYNQLSFQDQKAFRFEFHDIFRIHRYKSHLLHITTSNNRYTSISNYHEFESLILVIFRIFETDGYFPQRNYNGFVIHRQFYSRIRKFFQILVSSQINIISHGQYINSSTTIKLKFNCRPMYLILQICEELLLYSKPALRIFKFKI